MSDHIPAAMQAHYDNGQEARRAGVALPSSRIISPEGAWWRAGWHDADISMGGRYIEVAQ